VAAAVIATIPVLGWLVGLTLTIFGIGIIAVAVMNRRANRDAVAATTAAAPLL